MPRFLITVNEWGTAQVPARVAIDLPTQRFISADDADGAIRRMEEEHGRGATIIDAVAVPIHANGGASMDEATRAALEDAAHLKPSTRQRIASGIADRVKEEPTHSYVHHTWRERTSDDTVFEFQEFDSDDNLVYTAQHEAFNAVILKLPEGYFLDGVVPHFIAIPNFRVEPVRPNVSRVSEPDKYSELADALRAFLRDEVSDGWALVTASTLLKHIESHYTLRVPKPMKVSEGRPVYRVPRRRMHIEDDGGLTYCGELIALLSPGSVLDDDAATIIEYEPKGTCGRCIHYALIEVSQSTFNEEAA